MSENEDEASEAYTLALYSNPQMVASSSGMVDSRKGSWATIRRERLRTSLVKRHAYFELSSFSQRANGTYAPSTMVWLPIDFQINSADNGRGFDQTMRTDHRIK